MHIFIFETVPWKYQGGQKIHSIDKSNEKSILKQVIFPVGEWGSLNIIQVQYARSDIKDQHLQIL